MKGKHRESRRKLEQATTGLRNKGKNCVRTKSEKGGEIQRGGTTLIKGGKMMQGKGTLGWGDRSLKR